MIRGACTGMRAAFSYFSCLPVGPVPADRVTVHAAVAALPWMGLCLGAAAATASGLMLATDAGQPLAVVTGLGTLAAITGAMHLDGLADTADGLGSRKPRDQALEIMRRSDIGPMGVTTLVLLLLLDVAALLSPALANDSLLPGALFLMPAVGRVPVLAGTTNRVPSARPDGFGALFAGVTSVVMCRVTAGLVLVIAMLTGWVAGGARGLVGFAIATTTAWLVAHLWQRHLMRRLGGLTGDTLGSLIEVTQAAFTTVVALVAAPLLW